MFTRIKPTLWLFVLLLPLLPAGAVDVWGPVLGEITPTSVQISWRDNQVDRTGIVFLGKQVADTAKEHYHSVTLTGLKPDTEYSYILQHNSVQDSYTFRTPPQQATEFTFAVYGDTRTNHKIHRLLTAAISKLRPAFVINTGDLVGDGEKSGDWDTFFAVATPLTGSAPYFAAPGNHEENADIFYRLFPGAPGDGAFGHEWYATQYGNVRIIVLNSTRKLAEQRDWLERTLAAPTTATWTVVTFHSPPFSSGSRNGDNGIRKQWVPLLERYHVDAAFLGHDHFYEHSVKDGIHYFIAGGGGAPLYAPGGSQNPYRRKSDRAHHFLQVDVTNAALRVHMFRLDGSVGDEVIITKGAAQRPGGIPSGLTIEPAGQPPIWLVSLLLLLVPTGFILFLLRVRRT